MLIELANSQIAGDAAKASIEKAEQSKAETPVAVKDNEITNDDATETQVASKDDESTDNETPAETPASSHDNETTDDETSAASDDETSSASDDESPADSKDDEATEDEEDEDDTSSDSEIDIIKKTVLEEVDILIFSNNKKIAKASLQLSTIIESTTTLSDIGSDIDSYEVAHRGIVLRDVNIFDETIASKVFNNATNSTTIIPYRFLRSDITCNKDNFLGYSCSAFFKSGPADTDFSTTLYFTFGFCNSKFNSSQMRNFESSVELLIKNHKQVLAEKIRQSQVSAQEYSSYSKLYEDAVSKKNFASQIPEVQEQYDAKTKECEGIKTTYDTATSEYEKKKAVYDENLVQINNYNNEINTLTSNKKSLESAQIARATDTSSYEDKEKNAEEIKKQIIELMGIIKSYIDPNFFSSVNNDCFDSNKNFKTECTTLLNRIQ